MDLNDLISKITAFRDARDWKQFHKFSHLATPERVSPLFVS